MILMIFQLLLNPTWAIDVKINALPETAQAPAKNTFLVEQKINFKKAKQQDNTESKKSKTSLLRTLKEHEQSKKWKECAELAPNVIKNFPTVRPWILQTWAICVGKEMKEKKDKKDSALLKPYEYFEKNRGTFDFSNGARGLRLELQKDLGIYIDSNWKSDAKSIGQWIQKYAELSDEKESKAKALAWSGDLAMANHLLGAAESFFDQSLQLVESKANRDKLNSVRLALNFKKEEVANGKTEVLSESEQKYEERFKVSLKNNDLIAFIDDSVSYLAQFPSGKKAKWCFEKIQDIYLNFSDKSSGNGDEKFSSLREKALEHLEKLEPNRLLEVARSLHRRGDFVGSLRLAEKSYGRLSQSQQGSLVLYIMGRCAQFTGDYKKARKYFEQYLELHSAAEDVGEVQFRLALVHFRLAQYSSAVAVLEKLLLSKSGDRYDLLGRYWLIRSLQATQNQRASDEIRILLEKYPFSYYGLRLKAEAQGPTLDPLPAMSEDTNIEEVVYWTGYQKQIWDRVLLLGQNGWTGEALAEFAELTMSSNPKVKILLAQKLVQNKIYSPAIKMIMDSLDLNSDLKVLDILSMSLPVAYDDAISAQARKNSLNPILVRSLIRQESAFNEKATSVSKAMGLMQLIPPTAQEVAQDLGMQGLELPQDSYLPSVNVQMGSYYIARMIKQFGGNVPLGLAAYNAGPTKMTAFIRARPEVQEMTTRMSSEPADEIWFDELPWNETSFYVKAILRNTILYRLKSGEKITLSPVLWSDLRLAQ